MVHLNDAQARTTALQSKRYQAAKQAPTRRFYRLYDKLFREDVRTIREMGWAGKKNGELLALMVGAGFAVLLTVDQNLRYQQNLAASGVAVVVMVARTAGLWAGDRCRDGLWLGTEMGDVKNHWFASSQETL